MEKVCLCVCKFLILDMIKTGVILINWGFQVRVISVKTLTTHLSSNPPFGGPNVWSNISICCKDKIRHDYTELGCVHLIIMCHTCGCVWTLDVEASLISMSGSGSSSSSSCCSGSSSSGMTTTGFTCFASAAACRKLGGAWSETKKRLCLIKKSSRSYNQMESQKKLINTWIHAHTDLKQNWATSVFHPLLSYIR